MSGAAESRDFLRALRRTIELVESSQSSSYSTETVGDIADQLRAAVVLFESRGRVDRRALSLLFAPTGSIQETSNDNGWGDEYVTLASVVDDFLEGTK